MRTNGIPVTELQWRQYWNSPRVPVKAEVQLDANAHRIEYWSRPKHGGRSLCGLYYYQPHSGVRSHRRILIPQKLDGTRLPPTYDIRPPYPCEPCQEAHWLERFAHIPGDAWQVIRYHNAEVYWTDINGPELHGFRGHDNMLYLILTSFLHV